MVGRLRMPVEVAIGLYQRVSQAFLDGKPSGVTEFEAIKLTAALKAIVLQATGDEDTRMMDTRPDAEKCRTMVFAMPKHDTSAGLPPIFRSYQGAAQENLDCRIWEALHAIMSRPELFESADIDEGPTRESFVAGSLGRANPVAHVLSETATLYPEQHVSCIISIGASHARVIRIPKSSASWGSLPMDALVAMKGIGTDTERVAQEIAIRFRGTQDLYLRFNVNQGAQNIELDGWGRSNEATNHVRSHNCRVEDPEQMERAVKAIAGRAAIGVTSIDEQMPTSLPASVKICPPPLPIFTGREDEIEQIRACLSPGDRERRVFVLHGLGGTGKTQIALKAIEQTSEMWTDVVYINAVSRDEIVAALQQFALARKIGGTHDDTTIWLGARKERWLMVFDNTDDPSLNITDFFPRGDHGSILITTRASEITLLARGPSSDCVIGVSSMNPEDAAELLLRAARMEDKMLRESEHNAVTRLLKASHLHGRTTR
ncbi:hypothetical protein FS749_000785 [Ceratobasidium sp. UAMH 11750]|nr:hypothetical protein FS749_000785 [Ceratobasidium sp. UAMH 11750]